MAARHGKSGAKAPQRQTTHPSGQAGQSAPPSLPFKSTDIRFTVGKDGSLYVWCMAVPAPGEILKINSLGTDAKLLDKPIKSIQLLGGPRSITGRKPTRSPSPAPEKMPFKHAVGFKVTF